MRAQARRLACGTVVAATLFSPGSLLRAAAGATPAPPPQTTELRGEAALARVYDDILDAGFEAATAEAGKACAPIGPAPREACDVLAATSLWWQIQLDPESPVLDANFLAAVDRAIDTTEAWAAREPSSAEAHFYVGAAYAARVQWRVLRDEKLTAARDGKRIKEALEDAVRLDPNLEDAYFGIGLYEYYADVAPASAKLLRFLLMLPGGNRADGLAKLQRARTHGRLLQGEADYQLQVIDLWYERRPDLAVEILSSLRERYPGNPLFAMQLASVQDRYQHDLTASLSTWRDLLEAVRTHSVNEADVAATTARLGEATILDALDESDRALDAWRAAVTARPQRPAGSLAAAYAGLGTSEDRLGHRDAAIAAYRLALAITDRSQAAERAQARANDGLRHPPDVTRADAYRVALEGLRDLERGRVDAAEPRFIESLTRDPGNLVTRVRYARLLETKKEPDAALAQLETALAGARSLPAPIAADAFLAAARLHAQRGDAGRAISCYTAAADWFGGSAKTHAAAHAALSRLHAGH